MTPKLHITIAVPGLPIGPDSIEKGSIGGSETAGIQLAEAFGRLGHQVTLFANCPGPAMGPCDVAWRPLSGFASFAGQVPHDVTIVQRDPSLCGQSFASRLTVLWNHDLALRRNAKELLGVLWNVDVLAVLSRFHLEQYREVLGLPEPLLWQTRNGLDLSLFSPPSHDRDMGLMVYAARPERGLDRLLKDIWPRVRARLPEARLVVAGYYNPVDHLREFYSQCRAIADSYQGSVTYLENLTKRELYQLYGRAGCMIYPHPSPAMPDFAEISWITGMECQAMGLPIVTSALGAMHETVAEGAGVLIDVGDNYADRFVDEVVRLHDSRADWVRMSHVGPDIALAMSWDVIAREWLEMFEERRKEHNDDAARLARHFARRSDIMAARQVLSALKRESPGSGRSVWPSDTAQWIDNNFSFINDPETARAHYELIGKTHTDSFESAGQEPRLRELIRWMGEHEEVTSVLDVGCAQGCYAIHLSNAVERLRVLGIDHDKHSIEWAIKYRDKHASYPINVGFENTEGTESFDWDSRSCLLLCEILEHVKSPWELVDEWEQHISSDGWVYITVPRGPWEHMSYRTYPYRCHVWEFDQHDLSDMFGKKKNVSVAYMANGQSNLTGDPIGWHVVTYQVSGVPTGKIDMARKLVYQRPRQSISALIIAGPGVEDTVGWCLAPLRDIVDEIVVADNGLSEAALTILHMTGAKVVPGANPMEHGFDVSRNLALEACSMDWVLWIDTDERLVQPDRLSKYLKSNHWQGYGLRQHHFAVDTKFDPDMPVRLFRRAPRDGKSMRFIGRCLAGETEIDMPGGSAPIQDLVGQQPLVYAYDVEAGGLTIAKAKRVWKSHTNAPVLAIELDDGSVIRATPDHRFLMRRGHTKANGFKEAGQLKPGDRLMPLHRYMHHGYSQIRIKAMDYRPEHRFVYECISGPIPEGFIVHHLDDDRTNNSPSNLMAMDSSAPSMLHHIGKVHSEETRRLISERHAKCDGENNVMYGLSHSQETRDLIGLRSRERGAGYGASEAGWFTPEKAAANNKLSWQDPEIRAKRIAGIKEACRRSKMLAADNHKVVSVTGAGHADVYDMEVPGPHTFIAGGVVSHNCHEHPELSLNEGPGPIIVLSDIHIGHVGYLDEGTRQARYWRNLPLLQKDIADYPERLIQKHFLMRDNMLMSRYILTSNGGQMTPQLKGLCEETVQLYRKYFLGKPGYVNIDSLQYYSEALRFLGRGFDVEMKFVAEPPGKLNGGALRFENQEDLRAELDWRVKDAVGPLVGKYY